MLNKGEDSIYIIYQKIKKINCCPLLINLAQIMPSWSSMAPAALMSASEVTAVFLFLGVPLFLEVLYAISRITYESM